MGNEEQGLRRGAGILTWGRQRHSSHSQADTMVQMGLRDMAVRSWPRSLSSTPYKIAFFRPEA